MYQRRRNVAQLLRDAHVGRRGLHAMDAEQAFVKHVQALKEYGQHLYSAIWVRIMFSVCAKSIVFHYPRWPFANCIYFRNTEFP